VGLDRRPGWYPDDRHQPGFRFWDGEGWARMRSDRPVWDPIVDDGPDPWWGTAPRVPDPPPRRWTPILVPAIVAVALLVGGGLFLMARGDDAGPAASGTASGSTDPDGGPAPTVAGTSLERPEPAGDCATDGETLRSIMASQPDVGLATGGEALVDVRCTGTYAAGRAGDGTIAVFVQQPAGWTLVALGTGRPCDGLELPAGVADALAC
jgi:hypothetical protein